MKTHNSSACQISEEDTVPDIVTVDSKVVYANRWMTVREDNIRRRDGSPGLYGYVDKPDFVMILPFDGERVHLVQQYRYPVGSRQWEFPQGSWEDNPEVDPEELACGELEEETGLIAGSIQRIGLIYPLYGTVTQRCNVFFATKLTNGTSNLETEEQDLVAESFAVEELQRMIIEGEIQDAGTIAAFGLARLKRLL